MNGMNGTRQMVIWACLLSASVFVIDGCASNPVGSSSLRNVSSGSEASGQPSSAAIVRHLHVLAQSGQVDNSPFIAGQSYITQVKQRWGQPDTQNTAGAGMYATYNSKHAAFGFNQNGFIFDVRTYSKQVQSLSLSDVRAILGNPNSTTTPEPGQVNEIYQVNSTYQLQFIINTHSNKVDHVSVFDASAVSSSPQQPTTSASSQIPIRGIIEGFYGTPWSDQERINMFQFMQKENLNTYVYAPKGDPYQRVNWRLPYPAAQLAQMKTLVTNAQADSVRFVYSISPGMTGTSTSAINASITYSSASDRKALEAKIDQLRSIGVNTFMLSFDDIETQLKPADQEVYGNNYAKAQMELANQILSDEQAKDPSFQLWFTPTSYYGLVDGPYWQTLRSTLNQNIKVIWTGKWVLNPTITSSQAKTITQLLGRKPILWDNYPVNDYTYNQGNQPHLLMGPLQGRDATLLNNLSGYISNPMLQPEASKLPLQTIADYLQNPVGYQPKTDWEKSITQMPGITNPALFKTFAEFNTTSTLNSTSYAPTQSMIAAFWNASSASGRKAAENQLASEFHTLASLPNTLPPTITDHELLTEIQPWLTKLGEEGQGGLDALNVMEQPSQRNKQTLSQQLKLVNASPYAIGRSIIAFMNNVASNRP